MCTLIMSIQSIQPAFAFKQNNQTHPHAKQAKAINPQTSPSGKRQKPTIDPAVKKCSKQQ